jgi:tetratricopeptide (TPR) repeat protein
VLRRHRVFGVLVGLGLAAAPAWAEAPAPPAAETLAAAPASQAQEWMGPPRPAPAGTPVPTWITGDDPVRRALWRAWSTPDELKARALRLQRAGLSAGIGELDAPARALLLDPKLGDPLERASLAVELAPGLPAAHAALAAEHFERWEMFGAMNEMQAALETAPEHLEARLWLRATAYDVLFGAVFAAALGYLGLVACAAFPRFARDLRRLRELPAPSAGALAAAIVLLPVAMGEGLTGLGLGLLAFALVNGSGWRRLWVMSAGALMLLALYPLLERRAESHAALVLDPVAVAAWSTEQGTPSAVELVRVLRAAEHDPLASRAVALRLARQGQLAEAEGRFMRLVEQDDAPDLVANTAAVRLLRGDVEGAIALYEQAARASRSAVIRFDLAQAYGRAIKLDIQELALAEAQSIDPDVLSKLNHRYNGEDGAFVAYLPLPVAPVLERLSDPAATAALARSFRAELAPGVMGETRGDAVVAFWIAVGFGLVFGVALGRWVGPEEDLYVGIARLLQTKGGDSMERMEKLQELRRRQRRAERAASALAWLVPGAAGIVAKRPLLALLAVASFAGAASFWLHRDGAVPDPLALGVLPVVGMAAATATAAFAYLVLLFVALSLREKR